MPLSAINLAGTIDRRHPGLFVKFGGHAMAAGLTIRRDDIEGFQAAFSVAVGQKLDGHEVELRPVLQSDGDIEPLEITDKPLSVLDEMAPWGRGFEPPVFESELAVLCARAVSEEQDAPEPERQGWRPRARRVNR